jgi:hypothetical protein
VTQWHTKIKCVHTQTPTSRHPFFFHSFPSSLSSFVLEAEIPTSKRQPLLKVKENGFLVSRCVRRSRPRPPPPFYFFFFLPIASARRSVQYRVIAKASCGRRPLRLPSSSPSQNHPSCRCHNTLRSTTADCPHHVPCITHEVMRSLLTGSTISKTKDFKQTSIH